MGKYRTRVALSVFENAAALALAVNGLLAAGIAAENLIRVPPEASVGTPPTRTPSQARAIAEFGQWTPPKMAAELSAAIATGAVILIVVVSASGTEQTVSRILLESSARSVQLHDLGV